MRSLALNDADRRRLQNAIDFIQDNDTDDVVDFAALARDEAVFFGRLAGTAEAELRRRMKDEGVTQKLSRDFLAKQETPKRDYTWFPEILEADVRPLLIGDEWEQCVTITRSPLRTAFEALEGICPTAIDIVNDATESPPGPAYAMWANVIVAHGRLMEVPIPPDEYKVNTKKLLNIGKARGGALAEAVNRAHEVIERDPKITYAAIDNSEIAAHA